MPGELHRRRSSLVTAAGASGAPAFGNVQDAQHRDVDVLTLYPIDLVSVDEHFGSWMTQYAYANSITQSKLLELGRVKDGKIELAGRTFFTLMTTFEPFPSKQLLNMMKQMAETGGKVVWSGPPPVLSREGEPVLAEWRDLFGVDYDPGLNEGITAAGKRIEFEGILSKIDPQIILTHFLVDHIYPVRPRSEALAVAAVHNHTVGTYKQLDGGGTLTFLGFRPRDDQAKSLGYEVRTLFDILDALGAYPPSGKFNEVNDNTEYISRTSDYFACHFPNGTISVAPHLKSTEENWGGGFARNEEQDRDYLAKNPPPPEDLHLAEMKIHGRTVTYDGGRVVAFRVDDAGDLIAFAGHNCRSITIDGREYQFSGKPAPLISFAPVPDARRVDGGALYIIMIQGQGEFHLPIKNLPEQVECLAEGATLGSRGEVAPSSIQDGSLVLNISNAHRGRWIFVVEKDS
ncbi:MAG: hypothetical protein ACP5I1_09905 [Candidatus Hinthialibacter sp.]